MSQGWANDRPPWHGGHGGHGDRGHGHDRGDRGRTKLPPPATHALPPPPPGASGAIEFRSPRSNGNGNAHGGGAERNGASGSGAREPGELSIRGRAASPPSSAPTKPLLERLGGTAVAAAPQPLSSQPSQPSQVSTSSSQEGPAPRRPRSPGPSGPSSYRPDDSGPSRPPAREYDRFSRDNNPYGRREDRHDARRDRDDRRRSRSPGRDHRDYREPARYGDNREPPRYGDSREPPRYGDRHEGRYDARRDDRRDDRYGGGGRYGDDYGRRGHRPDEWRRDTRDARDARDAPRRDTRDSRDGYDSYRPPSPRGAGRPDNRRSPERRTEPRASPRKRDVEEGEIDGAEEGEVETGSRSKAEEGEVAPIPPPKSPMQPREPSNPPPPPPEDAPPPPDAPPPSEPPPPSGSPKAKASPAPPPLPPKSGAQSPKPRPIDSVPRPHGSGKHAPNRNLAEPVTRVSTPIARDMLKEQPRRHFRFPTAEDEKRAYGRQFIGTTTLAAYDLGIKLGEGTFGVVTKAVEQASRKPVALKKLIIHNQRDGVSVTTVREIKILKELNHPNIVPLLDMVVQRKVPSDRSERGEVFMVFPFMDHDLCGLLLNKDFRMSHSVSKLLFRQILEGVNFMHINNIIHRDLKTANILVSKEGHVMIADFGLARTLGIEPMPKHSPHEYTNMVVTRWYRAPELLLGDCHYTTAIDLWSLGCILGEMYHHEPIFPGESEQNQLFRIFNRVGPPSQAVWPDWDKLPGMPEAAGQRWDQTPRAGKSLLQCAKDWQMDRVGAQLLVDLLQLNPAKRPTAEEALNHIWFSLDPLPAKLGTIPVVESSHEMTSRERNPPAPVPAYQRQPSQPAGAPSWVGGGQPRPPPAVHHRQGRPPHMGPGRGYGGPPAPYRPPPPSLLPNAPAYPPVASGGMDGMSIGRRGPGGHNAPAPPFRGGGRPPGGPPMPFRLAGGMAASTGPSFNSGGVGRGGAPGYPPPKRPAADDPWRADKRPRRDDSLPY